MSTPISHHLQSQPRQGSRCATFRSSLPRGARLAANSFTTSVWTTQRAFCNVEASAAQSCRLATSRLRRAFATTSFSHANSANASDVGRANTHKATNARHKCRWSITAIGALQIVSDDHNNPLVAYAAKNSNVAKEKTSANSEAEKSAKLESAKPLYLLGEKKSRLQRVRQANAEM